MQTTSTSHVGVAAPCAPPPTGPGSAPGVTDLTAGGAHLGPGLAARGSRFKSPGGGPARHVGAVRGGAGWRLGSRATCGGTRPRLFGSRADAGAHRAGDTGTRERPPRHTRAEQASSSHERRQVSHTRIQLAFSGFFFGVLAGWKICRWVPRRFRCRGLETRLGYART